MSISETRDFHPLVQQWLESQGYECTHEFTLPDYGRVDFMAVHKSSEERLLVECKTNPAKIAAGLLQLQSYRLQIPGVNGMLAIPRFMADESHLELADKYGITIAEFDVIEEQDDDESETIHDPMLAQGVNRLTFIDQVIRHPNETLNEVITYHSIRKTCPVFDLLLLTMFVQTANPACYSDKLTDPALQVYLSALIEVERSDSDDFSVASAAIEVFKNTQRTYVMAKSSGNSISASA